MAFNLFKKKGASPAAEKPAAAPDAKPGNDFLDLPVKAVVQETADAVSIVFDIPNAELPYKPGQFLTLVATIEGKEVRRSYSLCTSPLVDDHPAVAVKRVEGGLMSNWVNSHVTAGQTVKVMKPMGNFTTEYNGANQRHMVLFGGGSGITPLLGLAKHTLTAEPQSRVSLVYANRNLESIIFKGALEALEAQHGERFTVVHVLDQAPEGWEEPAGLLNPELLKGIVEGLPTVESGITEYFMCGPEGMMNIVAQTFDAYGWPKDALMKESFASATAKRDEAGAAVTADGSEGFEVKVIYDDEEHSFLVPPGKFILETAQEHDIDLPYSCQSGLCTACRGKKLSGTMNLVEQEGLSDAELEEGYVLTCVGQPTSADVVVEIG